MCIRDRILGVAGVSVASLESLVVLVAAIKIVISFAWMITVALQPTMGVAWHRFLAFPNIWFKRESSGRTALGNLKPMTMGDGTPFSMEAMEAMEEAAGDTEVEPVLGVGKVLSLIHISEPTRRTPISYAVQPLSLIHI